MGFKEFWARLTSGDKVERVEEELQTDREEQPKDPPDYQELRDDVKLEGRFGRPMSDDER